MMHICVVIFDFHPRGVQRAQVRLANAYISQGHVVDALVLSNQGVLAKDLSSAIRVIDLVAPKASQSYWRLLRYLRKEQPDVVFSAEDHVNVMVLLASLFAPAYIKYSVSCHVSPILWAARARFGEKRWLVKTLAKFLYPKADQCVGLSSGMIAEYEQLVGLPSGLMKVIYNPVLSPHASPTSSADHPWLKQSSVKVVTAVGHLSRIKGFDILIRALSIIADNNVRLLIAGEGRERESLTALVGELDMSERVDFLGHTPQPESYMQGADVFVLSSRSEGLPTVLIEAISVGCPVVSTRCGGGALEIMEHGRLGPLVDVADVEGLALAIRQVLDNPPIKLTLLESAQRFRSDVIAYKYLEGVVK